MLSLFKKKIFVIIFSLFVFMGISSPLQNPVFAAPPTYDNDFKNGLVDWNRVLDPWSVSKDKTLRQNIVELFYPNDWDGWNRIFNVLRDMTLWVMIIFIVIAWASLLMWWKWDDMKKSLWSLMYIMLGWLFIYMANRLFWSVLHFDGDALTQWEWIWWVKESLVWANSVMFKILSAIKAFAFFLAIIMIVVTWFKVISAGEWDKWKKLVKWLINVVVALIIIKWVDFIYYMAADSTNFAERAADFIINVAKIFAYIYWIIIVLMVFVAWYLYITDWWSWSWFKKASNILVNILLSWLILFSFLLILYQIFAEFSTWWDAVPEIVSETLPNNTTPLEQI